MYKYSGITVKELLELEIMKDAKILAGEGGLDRRITKLNVMEVPDIVNWVEDGEFLLTTAYSIKDNLTRLDELISELNKKGLAGMGIKTKRYINEIPDNTLKVANELGFSLIEIPFEVSYSSIIADALTEIVNNQTNILYRIDNTHNKLINLMLSGGSLKEIAKALYESIDENSMAIKEYLFETSVIFCDEDKKKHIETIVEADSLKKEKFNYGFGEKFLHTKHSDILGGEKVDRLTIPIFTKDREYGCIYIWEDKKQITPVELTVIEASTPIIALDLYKKQSIFEIESKHKVEFFEDLFSSEENRHQKALERASYFDFDSNLGYSVIVISLSDSDKYSQYNPDTNGFLQQINVRLLSIINRITRNRKERIIYGNKSNSIIILFGTEIETKEAKIKQDINSFCNEILSYAEYEYINDKVSIGVGRNYKNTHDLWKGYREANRAVECQKRSYEKKVTHYDDLGIFRILSYEELQPELQQFYKEILEPLVRYDNEKGTELIETLKKYFECAGNLKKISEEMYTHYNTVIYRIQRIKEITGIDFENYNDRLNFQISLKILEMQENERPNRK
ncbi:PucR family transcriptional regulator [Proteiniborus sp. MB09-C3]|uniref:PucR family transcriptional regulator n=1 Tax=Proteiniborus sp. MB09-C3 TaxID=3050072 RepID=UPI002552435A|nr:PucR family transcriptional regulator [Proteiniborus sp. MB09-C3]WIV11681.1 PucR family transcriptional regulator ligand-binding domain-containing protein [Proteiniborus sp. MB09-C3]